MTTSNSNGKLSDEVQRVLHDPGKSSLQKYAVLAVGSPSVGQLIKYELVILLFSGCPGALGYWLRRKAYRLLFKSMGRRVTIGRNVTLRCAGRISLGDDVVVDDNAVLDARGAGSSMDIGKGVLVGRNTIVRCRGESLRIGEGTDIGCNCIIATDSRLEIGGDVLIAAYTYVAAGGTHRYDDKSVPIIRQGFDKKGGVTIGDGAWIGSHTTLLDGSSVGKGSIVGSHSLVNSAVPEMVIAFGVPAKVHKPR
jgi:acetyltransferase-like isoleucine patch superfamily enzyme